MRVNRNRTPLAVAVPVHNEERRLPRLFDSLRAQTAVDVPVVFVDNGSTDASGALMRACPEVARGRWICLEEPRVGKATAMATATAYCSDDLGARHVCFLDADSYCLDEGWIATSASAAAADGALGYVYSPLIYSGLERTPVFAGANRACEAVLHRVIRNASSFAPACGATYPADLLLRFLRGADSATEQGLRLSLLALWEGRLPILNPGVVVTSGRRFVLNGRDLRRWCFYDREFYRQKDINRTAKLDLESPTEAPDLELAEVGLFFERQALKIATRNLTCPALFDSTGAIAVRVATAFAVDLGPMIAALRLGLEATCLFGPGLDELLQRIARFPPTMALARHLEALMREEYASAPPVALSTPPTLGTGEDPKHRSPPRG
jgi:glycosyltransferase involved in cell wall biosynthesis